MALRLLLATPTATLEGNRQEIMAYCRVKHACMTRVSVA